MKIEVLCHSSIRIQTEGKIIYLDPFRIKSQKNDADIIAITHSHYDHFSEEDIKKIKTDESKIILPSDLFERTLKLGFKKENIITASPYNSFKILDIEFKTIPSYNLNKEFHPKDNNWLGYILRLEGKDIYVAGDTDITEENMKLKCNIALVPVGGTYTMTCDEAAKLINIMHPQLAIPTHYGELVGKTDDAIKFKELVNPNIHVDIQI